MADQIGAKEYNLWELMKGKFIFSIPDYQRPYSWTENEAITLLDDLMEFWNETQDNTDQSYFIGSIVLVKDKNSPEAEVIDGQQRLTTLSMILSILRSKSKKIQKDLTKCLWEEGVEWQDIAGRPRVTLRKRDALFFEKYIAKGDLDGLNNLDPRQLEDDAQRLILRNTILLKEKIGALFENMSEKEIDSFIKTIFNKCFFVVVTTPDNESAFRVFSVLNNRGLSLLPSDILKAHIIGEIEDSHRQYYTDKWEDIEVDLGREAFNALFSHIRMIFGKNKLHGTLVSEFERLVFPLHKNKESIISNVIEPYAKSYKSILRCEYATSKGADEINELLTWLKRIDDSDWIAPVIYALSHFSTDYDFIREFMASIERLAAYFYITSKTSNQRIERYAKIISSMQYETKDHALEGASLSECERKAFIDALDGDIYLLPARKRGYVLLRLDRFISDKAATYENSIFSIEHVLPQNPKKNSEWISVWPTEEIRMQWVHRIANLVPLTRKKNSQAQNYDFAEKKKKYFSAQKGVTTYAITTEILLETEWTPKSIEARQKRLLAIFDKCWKLKILQENILSEEDAVFQQKEAVLNIDERNKQKKLKEQIESFFTENPSTLLPRLPIGEMKVGEYVHLSFHALSLSNFKLSEEQIAKLCSVEHSKKYTHRNLPMLVLKENADLKSDMMKRYWKKKSHIEEFNGVQYYVFSQWYPDDKISKDAHKSDFLQLYLDLAQRVL